MVKQPLAATQIYNAEDRPQGADYQLYEKDRALAIDAICGEICNGPGLREAVVVSHLHGQSWLVADLHNRNIMRDRNDTPTIIDALIGPVTPAAHERLPWLARHAAAARTWRQTGEKPPWKPLFELKLS